MIATRSKTIPLKPSKYCRPDKDPSGVAWTRSPAFAVNSRAVLVHRVRHVTTILYHGEEHHCHVHYLCGNGCNFRLDHDEILVSDPPTDRLLCDACERIAARRDLPSGDTLAGRHVHRGVLVPRQTCCQPRPAE